MMRRNERSERDRGDRGGRPGGDGGGVAATAIAVPARIVARARIVPATTARPEGDRDNGRPFFRRRKSCPSPRRRAPIHYKDVRLFQGFVSERGKIVPSRISAVSSKKQRELAQAIKRARHFLALLPYVISSPSSMWIVTWT